jgi:hypothetical protein
MATPVHKGDFLRSHKPLAFFLTVLLLVWSWMPAHAADAGSIGIERKTATLKGADKEADIHYPVFKGVADKALLARIQEAAGLKAGTGSSPEEWKEEFKDNPWLVEIDYQVTLNRHSILSLTYTEDGMGAHPSSSSESLAVNLRTGKAITAKDLFKPASLPALAARVDKALQAAVMKIRREREGDLEGFEEKLNAHFGVDNLDSFKLDERGVTFLYDFEFPHAFLAAEPEEEYFFSYKELKPFIDGKGLLAPFTK